MLRGLSNRVPTLTSQLSSVSNKTAWHNTRSLSTKDMFSNHASYTVRQHFRVQTDALSGQSSFAVQLRRLGIQRQDASKPTRTATPSDDGGKPYIAAGFNPGGGSAPVPPPETRTETDAFMEAINAPPKTSTYYPMIVLVGLALVYTSYNSGVMYKMTGIEALMSHDQVYFKKKKDFEEKLDTRRKERRREREAKEGKTSSGGVVKKASAQQASPKFNTFTFGRNTHGQIGNGASSALERVPVKIVALEGDDVALASAGGFSSAVITSEGELLTWGCSRSFELGHGTDSNEMIPSPVQALSNERVARVSIGKQHMVALTADGKVFTWGNGYAGRLGHGDEAKQPLPRQVEALKDEVVVDVAAGVEHTLCVTAEGAVYQWGGKRGGREGVRTATRALNATPERVTALDNEEVVRVCSGGGSLGALTRSGRVWTWGSDEFYQLGHGSRGIDMAPKLVRALRHKRVVQLEMGTHHAIALTADGEVFTWGSNLNGQLGLGHTSDAPLPIHVDLDGKKAVQVAAGEGHSAVILEGGDLVTFGAGRDGQLGYGGIGYKSSPTPVGLAQVAAVDLGCDHSIVLTRK